MMTPIVGVGGVVGAGCLVVVRLRLRMGVGVSRREGMSAGRGA